jgi:hypothetical protein
VTAEADSYLEKTRELVVQAEAMLGIGLHEAGYGVTLVICYTVSASIFSRRMRFISV